ncbi:elongator complex protein 5-like isoform X2 [Glandiceps talaboti]
MLEDILHGKESSRLVIVFDSLKHFGRTLLKSFTKSLASRVDEVHIFHFDTAPEVFRTGFDEITKTKLHSHDGWSDPLMWRETPKPADADNKLYLSEPLDLMSHIREHKQASSRKVAVIVDSLTPVLVHKSLPFVCKALYQLYNSEDDVEGFEIIQTLCLVHGDVHDERVLSSLQHIASSTLALTPNASIASFHEEPYGFSNTVHKKSSGKVIIKNEGYSVVDDLRLITFDPSKLSTPTVKRQPDPTANLTFNLNLTDTERQARSKVILPYTIAQEKRMPQLKSGQIFYEPDEADDFDDEDPDDDLDI